jgi:transcription initiation factor TFIIIB Brf1 subunit/transcription initiation factor TFIIB
MERERQCDFSVNGHENVSDFENGYQVCLHCGLVQDPIYLSSSNNFNSQKHYLNPTVSSEKNIDILEVFHRNNLPMCFYEQTCRLYTLICNELLRKTNLRPKRKTYRINKDEIMKFAVFHTLTNNKYALTPQEVLVKLGTSANSLQQFRRIETLCEKFLNKTTWSTVDFISRYATYLELGWHDKNTLDELITNFETYYDYRFNNQPQTNIAIVVILYCKLQFHKTGNKMYKKTVIEICNATNTSAANIHKSMKKLEERHKENIMLLQ